MICGNLLKSINSRAVAVISYGAGIIKMDKRKIKNNRQKDQKNDGNAQSTLFSSWIISFTYPGIIVEKEWLVMEIV